MTVHQADHYDDDEIQTDEPVVDEAVAGVSAWGVSIILHATVLILLVFVVMAATAKNDQAPIAVKHMDQIQEEDQKDPVEIEPEPEIVIKDDAIVDRPVIENFDLTDMENLTETDTPEDSNAGEEGVAMMNVSVASVHFPAIGPSASSSCTLGPRGPGARRHAVMIGGGSPRSEDATEDALRWFMRHQSPNGQWDVDGYPVNCMEPGPKCEPGTAHTNLGGDVACTGYALLCYLGRGYDHRTANRYQVVVKKGIDWLLQTQLGDGLLGKRNYEHAVATMALAEAYALTNDPLLHGPVQKAVEVILARQAQSPADSGYGLGWDYVKANASRNDSSVTGWNVMALKAAKAGGIDIGNGLEGAKLWLDGAWQAANLDHETISAYDESVFPYTWDAATDKVNMHNGNLTCVGALCAVFLGAESGDAQLESMTNWIAKNQTPTAWPTDSYYLYYNCLSMFQVGGEKWDNWNAAFRDVLVDSQRSGGCHGGSWDPQGAGGHGVSKVGRLLVTAYACLSLEVYYRKHRLLK